MTRPPLDRQLDAAALAALAALTALTALAALTVLPLPARAQANFDSVKVVATKVADGVWMLTGSGGNIGLSAGADASLLIDDQFAPLTPKILAAVKAVTPNPVKFLVNTHWHSDHAGGNENIGNTGAVIVAHDNVRERLSKGQFIAALKRTIPAAPSVALPVVTFPDQVEFHLNGETLIALHVAGAHTDGDVMVKFVHANVIHAGDVYVRYGFPFIDASSGGSFLGMIPAIEKLLAVTNASTKYIPGHGALATRSDVVEYLTMLRAIRDRTLAGIRKKQSVEALIAAKPLADYEAKFDPKPFVTAGDILTLAYGELRAVRKKK